MMHNDACFCFCFACLVCAIEAVTNKKHCFYSVFLWFDKKH